MEKSSAILELYEQVEMYKGSTPKYQELLKNFNKVRDEFEKQLNDFSQISLYIKNWKKEFENKNFTKMEKEYNKIEKEVKKLMPLEEMMKEAKRIEIIHNLIKENGQNFNIDKEQMDLIKTLGTI